MKGRIIRALVVGASLSAVGAWSAVSAATAAASVPPGYTLVSQKSITYTPGGDVGVACPNAAPNDGVGGGCFTPNFNATYVDATLADQVSQNTAGVVQFNDKTLNGNTIASVTFCGDSGPVKIPDGTAAIFITAVGPFFNNVAPAVNGLSLPVGFNAGASCGNTAFATTGTATLTQLVQTTTTTTT